MHLIWTIENMNSWTSKVVHKNVTMAKWCKKKFIDPDVAQLIGTYSMSLNWRQTLNLVDVEHGYEVFLFLILLCEATHHELLDQVK